MKGTLATVAILVIIAFCLTLALPVPAQAITDVTNSPDDATAGATTRHAIEFITEVDLVLAEGDQIIITFPSGFDASGAAVDAMTWTPSGTPPTLADATATVVTLDVAADEPAGLFGIVLTGIDNPEAAGSYTISIATTRETPAVDSASFTIDPAAVDHFTLNAPADITAGARAPYTVTRYDQFDNLVTSGAQTVYLFTNSNGVNAKFYDAAAAGNVITQVIIADGLSSESFWYYDEKAGDWTITASDAISPDGVTGIDDATDALTVNPSAIDHYTVTSASYSQTVDVAFTVTVTAYDEYDNVATNAGPVRVCMSSNPAIIVFNAEGNEDFSDTKETDICDTLSNGTFNIPAKAISTYTGVTITAEDAGGKTGTSDLYIISAADGDGNGTPTPTPTPTPTGPTIAFIPSSFNFMATEGGDNPANKTLTIWNSGTGTINWLLADNADWLTLTPTGGNSTGVADKDSVTLSVDISGMSAGSNTATITISASGATNTPRTVTVTLTILTPQTPTYTVGSAESWVETDDGKIILHFRAGSFASETNISIALKTIHGEAPEDFTLGETCFSITAEAELLRSIDVCVRYTDADVAAADGDPGKLRLAVYDETEGEWDVLSTSIDERTRTACARVDHLSDFAILAGPGPPGFFSADWWTVWWHITPIAVGLAIVIAVAIWLWSRYRYYY